VLGRGEREEGWKHTQNPPSRVIRARAPYMRFVLSSLIAFFLNTDLNANHVPTSSNTLASSQGGEGVVVGLGNILSPRKVPAATIAKPIHSP